MHQTKAANDVPISVERAFVVETSNWSGWHARKTMYTYSVRTSDYVIYMYRFVLTGSVHGHCCTTGESILCCVRYFWLRSYAIVSE